jgi:glycosyltransferase involved in cell wall biosynthesis
MAAYSPRPAWLRDAVRTALAQSGCSLELVIVDDGSPEPVAELLADLADPRLRVVRMGHAGLGAARNAGITESQGRYLRFLDADDLYPRDSTASLLKLTGGRQDVVACGATRWCWDDLEPMFDWPVKWHGDPLRALLLMRCTITPPASMLVPRALAEVTGPWRTDLAIAQDWDYQLRLLEAGKLAATKRIVSWYRRNATSLSGDMWTGWQDCARAVESYFTRNPEQRNTRLERQAYACLDLLSAEFEQSPRGPWRGRRFWSALFRDPASVALVYERQAQPRLSRMAMCLRSKLGQG